jgi:2-oxoisovalerate dehydrogenase E2 component (dihydrolipoyl transacylase)
MAVKVLLPQFGESVVEGTITKWLKGEGDEIEEYEPLVEVNTDKVDTEVPSPASGIVLRRLVEEGITAEAGTLIAWIGAPGELVPEAVASSPENAARTDPDSQTTSEKVGLTDPVMPTAEPAPREQETPIPAPLHEGPIAPPPRPGLDAELGFISPVVARMAAEHNLDLSRIQGTGRAGRITKRDVEKYLDSAPPSPSPDRVDEPLPIQDGSPAGAPGELVQLNPVRKAIATHMVESKHTSPHVTTVMEADLSRVANHRTANKAAFARDGANLTYTVYFITAIVEALKTYPIVNSSWTDDGIQLHKDINVGMDCSGN